MAVKRKNVKAARGAKEVAGINITHPDKELYPEIQLSKGELAEYYAKVSPLMLPEMRKRPLSIVRCPSGHEACFFQKHFSEMRKPPVPVVEIEEGADADGAYPYVKDVHDIVALVQLNVIEFHQWGCHVANVDTPDRLIIDLDPGEKVPAVTVIKGAVIVHGLLQEMGLVSFPKSTGGRGLHVVVPLTGKPTWDAVREFAKQISATLAAHDPGSYVSVSTKSKRAGKIYVDYLRNGKGSTSVANYSARARDGAPIAVPLEWQELENQRSLPLFHVKDVGRILKSKRQNIWKDLDTIKQTLPRF